MATGRKYTFTLDTDEHLTIFCNRREIWSGSFSAWMADGDAAIPQETVDQIHAKWDSMFGWPEEQDYGGVLGADGQIYSDADPGL